MKKLFISIQIFLLCVSDSFANSSYGSVGVRVTSDILPNFVNLIFGVNRCIESYGSGNETGRGELACPCGMREALLRIDTPKTARTRRQLNTPGKLFRSAKAILKWRPAGELCPKMKSMNMQKERLRESVNKRGANLFDERRCGELIYIEIKVLNTKFSEETVESDEISVKRLKKEIEDLGSSTNKSLDRIMRLIELSPETVSYFYSKYCSILTRQYYLRKPALSSEFDDYMNELKTCGLIREQSPAVALKEKEESLNLHLTWQGRETTLNGLNRRV